MSELDLRIFNAHGADLNPTPKSGQHVGDCPLCGKEKHFCVNAENGLWDCKVCGESGNAISILGKLAKANASRVQARERAALATDRGLQTATLRSWGVGWSDASKCYTWALGLTPGKVSDLRRYKIGGKPMSTPGAHLGLFWAPDWRGKDGPMWLCEGEWDAMATWEALRKIGRKDDVCAVPGASSFPRKCASLFSGREVRLCFDADEAGQRGLIRTWKILDGLRCKRKRIEWSVKVPNGWDMRDYFKACKAEHGQGGERAFVDGAERLLQDALPEAEASDEASPDKTEVNPDGKGLPPSEAVKKYRRWLDLPQSEVLDVLFGVIMANRIEADPLWMFIVAPPGGCKSELLMSLADAPLVTCVTSLTPHALISGSNTGGDPSLLPKIMGRTLVVKDFTTILTMNQTAKDEIFGTLRDAYDGRISKTFGNHVTRSYEGRFGIVGGVTPVIEGPAGTSSILGERFLKYRIRQAGHVDVGRNAIMRALDNITSEGQMRDELKATGKVVLDRPITRKDYPSIPQWFKLRVLELAQWVAKMRGSVGREKYTRELITHKPTSEIGTRLAKQLCTLALGVGVYHGKQELDEDVYRVIARVGVDTAPDRVEEIVRQLYCRGEAPADLNQLRDWTRFPQETCRLLLQDLMMLRVVERTMKGHTALWQLTDQVRKLIGRLKIYERDRAWLASSSVQEGEG